ncbi:MAG TPA: Ppx/GppA phosphatase family protein [Gemmatimonadaceae bacterium]|nr:Ppx/GppA phosphatase family protein [Gemmatimonadaceae bacterium]
MSTVIPLNRDQGPRGTIAPGHRRVAAIDIGSNSIRQIVADVSPEGAIQVVDEMKAAPRLVAGLATSGVIADTSMRAAVEAVERMATLARQLGAQRIDAVATSAVREASNAADLLAAIQRVAGLKVRVVDGDEEARLSFRSAVAHFDLGVGRTVVLDIGGGSLELALSAEGVIEHLSSLPFGAIRLTEEFFSSGISPKAVRRLRRAVGAGLKPEIPRRDWRGAQLIGSGGTFTNLAGIYLSRQGILTARSVHAAHIPRADLEHILDMLVEMSPEERREVPGLNPERADIIVAGLAVAAEVLRRLEARDIVVSRYGIREGLLLEAARVAPTIADPGEARARSVADFAERCHVEQPHSSHVQKLSLILFDALAARLGLDKTDRVTLADAALLHDAGYHISYERHHKHSYHLVLHADLLGMSPAEQVVVANVARYHRGSAPKRKQGNYGPLDRTLRRRIKRLASILRVADGFDRGHVGAVVDVKVRWTQRALRLTPVAATPRTTMRLEMWGASRKSGLLSDLAGVPVEIVAPDGRVLSSDDIDSAEIE